MSRHLSIYPGARWLLLCGAVFTLVGLTGCGPKPAPPAPAKPKAPAAAAAATNATPDATNTLSQYQSVFEDLHSPQGRDPFFPASHRRDPAPVAPVGGDAAAAAARPDAVLILKAILHTKKHSQAVINNEILEQGEEAQVRVPHGKVRVRCLEVGTDYVKVLVDGDAEPTRLVMTKKND